MQLVFYVAGTMLLLLCAACGGPSRAPAIGEAYVGPSSLNLRSELAAGSDVTSTVQHGEKLEILERRRRFARVRDSRGVEGWADSRMLLNPLQMRHLRSLGERSAKLPSQGKATVYDPLNVHTSPNRQAPTFYQIPDEGTVDVVGHRVEARVPYQPPREGGEVRERTPPPPADPQIPQDDWSLVRIPDGRVGWALTRRLVMSIPDDVAQYAEGHRITSYFSLGQVTSRGETKHHWLWTTLSSGNKPYQFDSFRVFVFNPRRHRYETSYIERHLIGYYPGQVQHSEDASMPSFSLLIQDKDGRLFLRTYAFQGFRVRLVDKSPASRDTTASEILQMEAEAPPPDVRSSSLFEKVRDALLERWRR